MSREGHAPLVGDSSFEILLAPDKFKSSLTAEAVTEHLETGLRSVLPKVTVRRVPVADGGEGTVEAAVAAGFTPVPVAATGPTGQSVVAKIAIRDLCAVVELASASGLHLLPEGISDALGSTSWGTGELICAALDRGCRTIILGVGGSACTDGGAGMLQALGGHLLDAQGKELAGGGAALIHLDRIDLTSLDSRLARTEVILASDVDNPLLGESGCISVYGPQKGASTDELVTLEDALTHWATLLDPSSSALPGAGAAGGVGYAALSVLHAHRRPGVDVLLELVEFERLLDNAQLVITGEGHMDTQSLHGKAPMGVAAAAHRRGVPVTVVNGTCSLDTKALRAVGITRAYALLDVEPDLERCMLHAGKLLEIVGSTLATDLINNGSVV